MKLDVAAAVISVTHGGHVVQVVEIGESQLCVLAEGVPPAAVAQALTETGAGRLVDYDQAVLSRDWWNGLQRVTLSAAAHDDLFVRVIY